MNPIQNDETINIPLLSQQNIVQPPAITPTEEIINTSPTTTIVQLSASSESKENPTNNNNNTEITIPIARPIRKHERDNKSRQSSQRPRITKEDLEKNLKRKYPYAISTSQAGTLREEIFKIIILRNDTTNKKSRL